MKAASVLRTQPGASLPPYATGQELDKTRSADYDDESQVKQSQIYNVTLAQ